ncbi:MAG: putative membrane protein [Cyclobacteriaceae bacterium]|jgi:putative membrane protein
MTHIFLILKGMAMGAANVIPGVSGGTIAFITGIYERLINSLKSFDFRAVKLLFSGSWKAFVSKIDLYFLASILFGIAISILSLSKVLEWAFKSYESLTLSFFFGLIVASIVGVGKQISKFNFSNIVALVIGVAIAAGIAFLPPAEPNESFLYLIICGMVAISSMILPGLSGSYILLLMGNYVLVIHAIGAMDFSILLPFALGCIVGLLLFAQVLSYLFKHFRDFTISTLTGFIAGSLAIIWPWKVTQYVTLASGKEKAVGYSWFLPELDGSFFFALVLALIGFLIVWLMEYIASRNNSNI